MRPLCQELVSNAWICCRPAVWQHPRSRVWFCEEHALLEGAAQPVGAVDKAAREDEAGRDAYDAAAAS